MKRRTTKQTGSILRVLLILLTLLLLVTGCEQPAQNLDGDASSDDAGLEVGFKPSGDALYSKYGAYKSATNKFDINDVTLEFYFGGIYASGVEHELTHSSNYPKFELWFENDRSEKHFIKSVDENFVSEKYRCYPIFDEARNLTEIKFNHSETFTIPPEMFSRESGTIWLKAYGENPRHLVPTVHCFVSVRIYYKVTDGTVTLSDQPFE